jgi:hypothetical protein
MTYAYKANDFETQTVPKNNPFKTDRAKAWRNLLVAAINEGLRQGRFSLEHPDEDQFEGDSRIMTYEFRWHDGWAICEVHEVGWDELSFTVGFSIDPPKHWRCTPLEPWEFPCRAFGWLERRKGVWLQDSSRNYQTKIPVRYQRLLADAYVEPLGFEDFGQFMF